jgi:hypothetical protein
MRFPAVLAVLIFPALVAANPDTDIDVPARSATPAAPTAESRFDQGQTLVRQSDWAGPRPRIARRRDSGPRSPRPGTVSATRSGRRAGSTSR